MAIVRRPLLDDPTKTVEMDVTGHHDGPKTLLSSKILDRDGNPEEIWYRERISTLIYPELATPPQRAYRMVHCLMTGHDPGDEAD